MIITRSKARRSPTPTLESESEEQDVVHRKPKMEEAARLFQAFHDCVTTKSSVSSYYDWGEYANGRKNIRKYDATAVPQHQKKNLKGLITEALSDDVLEGILGLAGMATNKGTQLDEEVYSFLSTDANAVLEMVGLGLLPYLPSDLDRIKLYPTLQAGDKNLSNHKFTTSSACDTLLSSTMLLEDEDPIIVPFTTEKFFADLEDNEPIADQILREMVARKTRMGQRRVSKRSKRTKLSTSLYLSQKYGGDQEFHSTPASRRRFRAGSTPKKEAILRKCPFKHRLLIKAGGLKLSSIAKKSDFRGRRGTGRS